MYDKRCAICGQGIFPCILLDTEEDHPAWHHLKSTTPNTDAWAHIAQPLEEEEEDLPLEAADG